MKDGYGSVRELSADELTELKQSYYCNELHEDEGVSLGELLMINDLVTDEEVFDRYKDTVFVEEDFFCNL